MDEILKYYEANVGFVTSSVYSEINCFLINGIPSVDILSALQKAVSNNKKYWGYAKSIIKNSIADKKQNEIKNYEIGDVPW